ncbi:MAG: T9SS type A sorting domain-containing protein, partial [Candidatus Cloacimonetes bacterium]|nr:T9SS type A sorting domain-containing protein [Candidatus Cloacimonadota bacterium]
FPPTISVAPYYNHMDINAGFDVMADIADPSGVMSADFMYRMGPGDWTSIAMSPVAGDTWEAAVPGIGGLANLEWKISATDFSPNENMAETASMFTEVNNDAWLHYDLLGESTNGLGLATGAWQAATLFDPGVWPVTLTEVESGIFLNGGPTNITFNLIIYNSDGTDGAPGTVLHTQSVTTPNAEMGIWTLDAPLEVIDPFYVAISISAGGYVYTDNVGYHFDNTSFLSTGTDWQTVEEINFQINWIMHVHATYATVDVAPEQVLVPNGIQLLNSYPNPFNPSTEIAFHLNHAQQVSVDVFNVQGEKVRTLANQAFEAGDHSLTFDASDLASGVYVAVLKSGAEQRSIKLTLVR